MTDLPALSGSLEAEGFGHDIICDRDWTGDGQIDLVISSPFANVNGVTARDVFNYSSTTTVPLQNLRHWVLENEWLDTLTSGDINGDGRLEMAVTAFEDQIHCSIWSWRERQTIDG